MFEKGNKLSQGRPKGAKNTLPLIRDKLFAILLQRIKNDKKLESVDTATLVKFVASSLPKDMSLAISKDPTITYISNVPRPDVQNSELKQKSDNIIDVSVSQLPQVVDTQ
jgi:hypothetical protein